MKTGFFPPSMGWVDDPAAVREVISQLPDAQGCPAFFDEAAPEIMGAADDDKPFLAWLAEDKVRGQRKPSWNQNPAGTCVSFGWGRGGNDLILCSAARGEIEAPPEDVATEPVYGLSRVEVGGGRIRGDGSVGAWAAKAVMMWGLLLRKVYLNKYDLTKYSVTISRDWGRNGVPDELEPIAKQFPVKTVTLCLTVDEAWKGLGNGYLLPICSNVGFQGSRYDDGFCDPRGNWNHCMLVRGRTLAKRKGRTVKAFAVQNSWGDYIDGEAWYTDGDGNRVELPEGCFLIEENVLARILAQNDSFLMSDVHGFPRRDPMDWLV